MTYATFNPLSLFVATVLAFALGSVWYGPLFGPTWRLLHGRGAQDRPPAWTHAVAFACLLAVAAALEVMADYMVLDSVLQALKLALLAFAGLVVPFALMAVAHGARPPLAWLLDAGYQLAALVVMSLVIVLWA